MKTTNKFRSGWILLLGFGVILIAVAIFTKTTNLNLAFAAENPYPPPDPTIEGTPTPKNICEKIYANRNTLPAGEKRNITQKQFVECLDSLEEATKTNKTKITLTTVPTVEMKEKRTRRLAGSGIIIYGLTAKVPPSLFWQTNTWYTLADDKFIYVFGGSMRDSSADLSRSAVLIEISDLNGNTIAGGGIFQAPSSIGPLSIVNASGEILTLISDAGNVLYFDVNTETFINDQVDKPAYAERKTDTGIIVDDPNILKTQDSYVFSNYWIGINKNSKVYVFVGRENLPNGKGVLAIINSDTPPLSVEKADIIMIPNSKTSSHNTIRIFDVKNNKVVMVGRWGETFVFDLNTHEFIKEKDAQAFLVDKELEAKEAYYKMQVKKNK